MRRIAIIGSGQVGLLAAHGFRKEGLDVTLYSDRTPEAWLKESRPTGLAGRFPLALTLERSLGLNHWDDKAHWIDGGHITLCLRPKNQLLTVAARVAEPGVAIDVRLQSHRWMLDLEERGGKVVIEPVTVERLDQIAAENDLTIVAAGKSELSNLFPRDAARSRYDAPARELAMVYFRGRHDSFEGIPFRPVKFEILDGAGEAFFAPVYHKDHGPVWCLLAEPIPGGPMDRFRGAKSGVEVIEIAKRMLRDLFPWDAEFMEGAELADENAWLVGRITQTIRRPVARLPSGRIVTPLGDTAMLFDPIGGQGANNGNKMAKNLIESVVARGDKPLDEAFLTETFERFYARHGRPTYAFNSMLLEPVGEASKMYFMCQYGSDGQTGGPCQRLADALMDNFNDPAILTDTLLDAGKTREFITKTTGRPWPFSMLRGGLGVARAQIRQRLGLSPGHPSVPRA